MSSKIASYLSKYEGQAFSNVALDRTTWLAILGALFICYQVIGVSLESMVYFVDHVLTYTANPNRLFLPALEDPRTVVRAPQRKISQI